MKSAYQFESAYSAVRDDFEPGTDNICLQILNGNLLRKCAKTKHKCFKAGYPTMRETTKKDDRWFYTYYFRDGRAHYRFYCRTPGKNFHRFLGFLRLFRFFGRSKT